MLSSGKRKRSGRLPHEQSLLFINLLIEWKNFEIKKNTRQVFKPLEIDQT